MVLTTTVTGGLTSRELSKVKVTLAVQTLEFVNPVT
jgi:hypothetical protein